MDRIVVVTGANRGLGLEAAEGLLAAGSHVILACRDQAKAEAAAADLHKKHPVADVTPLGGFEYSDPDALKAAVARLGAMAAKFNGIDIVINNAGVYLERGGTAAKRGQIAEQTFAVNYHGATRFMDLVLPLMRPGGRLVNVASRLGNLHEVANPELRAEIFKTSALHRSRIDTIATDYVKAAGRPGALDAMGLPVSAYGMSKALLIAATKVAAAAPETVKRGIKINAVCPGYCKTDMTGHAGMKTAKEGADVMVWMAAAPQAERLAGTFYGEREEIDWNKDEEV